MKKLSLFGLSGALLLLSTSCFAAEETSEDNSHAHIKAKHHKEGNLYVVTKGLISLGETYTEEATATEPEAKLRGNSGAGIGVDLGYRVGYGFAVELDVAYTHTTVTKSVVGEEDVSASANYLSYGLDLLYGYHLNEEYVLFGKIGWELEQERISDYGINGTDNGFAYAVGLEYGMTEHVALVGEYEGSLIEGPHGDTLFAGISYTF